MAMRKEREEASKKISLKKKQIVGFFKKEVKLGTASSSSSSPSSSHAASTAHASSSTGAVSSPNAGAAAAKDVSTGTGLETAPVDGNEQEKKKTIRSSLIREAEAHVHQSDLNATDVILLKACLGLDEEPRASIVKKLVKLLFYTNGNVQQVADVIQRMQDRHQQMMANAQVAGGANVRQETLFEKLVVDNAVDHVCALRVEEVYGLQAAANLLAEEVNGTSTNIDASAAIANASLGVAASPTGNQDTTSNLLDMDFGGGMPAPPPQLQTQLQPSQGGDLLDLDFGGGGVSNVAPPLAPPPTEATSIGAMSDDAYIAMSEMREFLKDEVKRRLTCHHHRHHRRPPPQFPP
jgi:hypothetical protein